MTTTLHIYNQKIVNHLSWPAELPAAALEDVIVAHEPAGAGPGAHSLLVSTKVLYFHLTLPPPQHQLCNETLRMGFCLLLAFRQFSDDVLVCEGPGPPYMLQLLQSLQRYFSLLIMGYILHLYLDTLVRKQVTCDIAEKTKKVATMITTLIYSLSARAEWDNIVMPLVLYNCTTPTSLYSLL